MSNIVGERFSKLYVVGKVTGKDLFFCACDCGGAAYVARGNLTDGRQKSCGCDRRKRYTRLNSEIEFNGKKLTFDEWAESLGITPNALALRLNSWSLEKALTTQRYKRGGK